MSNHKLHKLLIDKDKRTDEHAKVDSEIKHCISEGWNARLWLKNSTRASLRDFSHLLYSEVEIRFLKNRVEHYLKQPKQREIDYSGENH